MHFFVMLLVVVWVLASHAHGFGDFVFWKSPDHERTLATTATTTPGLIQHSRNDVRPAPCQGEE